MAHIVAVSFLFYIVYFETRFWSAFLLVSVIAPDQTFRGQRDNADVESVSLIQILVHGRMLLSIVSCDFSLVSNLKNCLGYDLKKKHVIASITKI